MSKISLTLTEYDSAMTRLVREIKDGLEKTDPILREIQRVPIAHEGTTRQVSSPKVVETSVKDFSAVVNIHRKSFLETNVETFVEFVWKLSDSLISETTNYLFETISLTTEAVGNVVNVEGKDLWDDQIEMLEKTYVRFDDNGNHNAKFYVPPDTLKKLSANPPTAEQQQRWNQVLSAKREEYYAKKRTRRLS
jgi:hypothetical protein